MQSDTAFVASGSFHLSCAGQGALGYRQEWGAQSLRHGACSSSCYCRQCHAARPECHRCAILPNRPHMYIAYPPWLSMLTAESCAMRSAVTPVPYTAQTSFERLSHKSDHLLATWQEGCCWSSKEVLIQQYPTVQGLETTLLPHTGSSEALLSGQKPPFRLLCRATSKATGARLSNIKFAVSEPFVVRPCCCIRVYIHLLSLLSLSLTHCTAC